MRRRFNDGRYWERALAGEFRCCLKNQHTPTGRDHPPGTTSFLVACDDGTDRRVFIAHLFATEGIGDEWTIRASGKPDPKFLVEDGVEYSVVVTEAPSEPGAG
jgi:hypothetical protein